MLTVLPKEQDDPEFVEMVTRILNAAVACHRPEDVYVIHIDNWFDHKWNAFSKVRLNWAGPVRRVPPFHPNRVVSQSQYRRSEAAIAAYQPAQSAPLHVEALDPHRNRRLDEITRSGLFFWYSGRSFKVDRASVMVYYILGNLQPTWYASFLKRGGWKIGLVKGDSSTEEIRQLLNEIETQCNWPTAT